MAEPEWTDWPFSIGEWIVINLNDNDTVKALVEKTAAFGRELNAALNGVRDPDILSEVLAGLRLADPRATAQLLMELLSDPLNADAATLDSEDKIFWAEVAAHMGPDWIEAMRVKAAFMALVDGFVPRQVRS